MNTGLISLAESIMTKYYMDGCIHKSSIFCQDIRFLSPQLVIDITNNRNKLFWLDSIKFVFEIVPVT